MLLYRWFWLSWKKSARLSWPSSQTQCVTWGKSRVPCVGGRTRGGDKDGGHAWRGERMRRKVNRTRNCRHPFPPPTGSGRRWGIICRRGAREQCTPRKPPCWTYDGVIIHNVSAAGSGSSWFDRLTHRQFRNTVLSPEAVRYSQGLHPRCTKLGDKGWTMLYSKTKRQKLTPDVPITTVSGPSWDYVDKEGQMKINESV